MTILTTNTDNNTPRSTSTAPLTQPKNLLHGVTLEAIVTALQAHYGWLNLAERIPINCFSHDPSIKSSLKFLRKTPWAREKVESLYIFILRDISRTERKNSQSNEG